MQLLKRQDSRWFKDREPELQYFVVLGSGSARYVPGFKTKRDAVQWIDKVYKLIQTRKHLRIVK